MIDERSKSRTTKTRFKFDGLVCENCQPAVGTHILYIITNRHNDILQVSATDARVLHIHQQHVGRGVARRRGGDHIRSKKFRRIVLLEVLLPMQPCERGAAFDAQQVCLATFFELKVHRVSRKHLGDVDVRVLVDLNRCVRHCVRIVRNQVRPEYEREKEKDIKIL